MIGQRASIRYGIATLAICSGVLLVSCGSPPQDVDVEFRIPVEAADVSRDTVERVIQSTGTLRPLELAKVNVEVPGLLYLNRDADGNRIREGDVVKAGDKLAEITGEDARLYANLDSTLQALNVADSELNRSRELFSLGMISNAELDTKVASFENAKHNYERSLLNASKATLTAPIDGVILKLARDANNLPVADGTLLSGGFELAQIGPVNPLVADINLIGPELSKVELGQPARVRHYAYEDRAYGGTVFHISPTLDAQTHMFRAEIEIDNTEGTLRPGMYVEVILVLEQKQEVLVIPTEAAARRATRDVVFIVDGQRVREQAVIHGLRDDEKIEILDGLVEGDRIVTSGLETLTDGSRIRVIES